MAVVRSNGLNNPISSSCEWSTMPWILCGYNVDNDRNVYSLGIETGCCSQALIIRAIHSVGGGIKLLRDAF